MAELKDRLRSDLTEAMKSQEKLRTATLRMLLAAIQTEEVSGKAARELTDEDVLKVLAKESKKRSEAAEIYTQNGRGELAAEEHAEARIIDEYLPTPLTEAEVAEVTTLKAEAEAIEAEWADAVEVPDDVDARVTELDERIAALNAERYSLNQNKKKILAALEEDQILFNPDDAQRLFEEAGVLFKGQIKNLKTFGESWGLLPSNKAEVFVVNHDRERGHGGGGARLRPAVDRGRPRGRARRADHPRQRGRLHLPQGHPTPLSVRQSRHARFAETTRRRDHRLLRQRFLRRSDGCKNPAE